MSGLFTKQESPYNATLLQDFERATLTLRAADPVAQIKVIHNIGLANTLFSERFGGMDEFRCLTPTEKCQYLDSLTVAENKLTKDGMPHAALGFALFKMWIGAVTVGDEDLFMRISGNLAEFSAAGDLSTSAHHCLAKFFRPMVSLNTHNDQ